MRCIETRIEGEHNALMKLINYNMRCIETEILLKYSKCLNDKLQHEMY